MIRLAAQTRQRPTTTSATPLARSGDAGRGYCRIPRVDSLSPQRIAGVHANLGDLLAKRGLMGEAVAELRTAARLEPDNLGTHITILAKISSDRRGSRRRFVAEYRISIRLQPNEAEFRF